MTNRRLPTYLYEDAACLCCGQTFERPVGTWGADIRQCFRCRMHCRFACGCQLKGERERATLADWKAESQAVAEGRPFVRCDDSDCLDRRLHYVQDCPPKDIGAYEYRKLQEQQS